MGEEDRIFLPKKGVGIDKAVMPKSFLCSSAEKGF